MTRVLYALLFGMIATNFAVENDVIFTEDTNTASVAKATLSEPTPKVEPEAKPARKEPSLDSSKIIAYANDLDETQENEVRDLIAARKKLASGSLKKQSTEPAEQISVVQQVATAVTITEPTVTEPAVPNEPSVQDLIKQDLASAAADTQTALETEAEALAKRYADLLEDDTVPETPANADTQPRLIVSGNVVNARAGPSTNTEVLTRLRRGTELLSTGETDGVWTRVEVVETGEAVWMHNDFIADAG